MLNLRRGPGAYALLSRADGQLTRELGGATRHPAHLTEEQVAQRVRQQVASLGRPGSFFFEGVFPNGVYST